MSENANEVEQPIVFESPPPAAMPAKQEEDPRQKLHAMARELMRARNMRLMAEYLRLRRSLL